MCLVVNEFAARAPSALFGVALILMQYLFLTRLRGQTAGLVGALMLLLNIEMLALGRMAITDSVLISSPHCHSMDSGWACMNRVPDGIGSGASTSAWPSPP